MSGYQSSVLTCHDDTFDDVCPVCVFLSGDRSQSVLMEVIARLDRRLFDVEQMRDRLSKFVIKEIIESKK